MSELFLWSLIFGLLLACGLALVFSFITQQSKTIERRLAPYLSDLSGFAEDLVEEKTKTDFTALGRFVIPSWLGKLLVKNSADKLKLLSASAIRLNLIEFRLLQLISGAVGVILAIALIFAYPAILEASWLIKAVIVAVLGIIFALLPGQWLNYLIAKRKSEILNQLPTVLEFLSLSMAAGETLLEALRRVVKHGSGELVSQLSVVVSLHSSGLSLNALLKQLADSFELPQLQRSMLQLTTAMEKGTPIAKALRESAQDLRQDERTRMIETAGKKELMMMLPLVFLILPIVVVFAIYPGIISLRLGF